MEIKKLTQDYETEKKIRIAFLEKEKNRNPPECCHYCTSLDIVYYCANLTCTIDSCKKCAFRHGDFKETRLDFRAQRIYSNDKIFWHCDKHGDKEQYVGTDKGYWLDETTYISHTETCQGCQKVFTKKNLHYCKRYKGEDEYLCDECYKIKFLK